MEDREERRVLDQSKHGQDLEELNREWYADAPANQLRPDQMEVFRIVTETMNKILEDKNPSLVIDQRLDPATRYALEALFEARMSRNTDTNAFISGLIRDKQLNQALMHLQPILAIALRPDFREGRTIYERLVEDLNHLRSDITSSILVEMPFQETTVEEKAEEQDDDDGESNDAGEGDGEHSDGDGGEFGEERNADPVSTGSSDGSSPAGEGNVSEPPEGGKSSWFGRLLGRREKAKTHEKGKRGDKDPGPQEGSGSG